MTSNAADVATSSNPRPDLSRFDDQQLDDLMGDDTLLNVSQVAQIVGCSVRTIYAMIHRRHIPHPLKLSAMTRWRTGTIRRWIQAGCPRR